MGREGDQRVDLLGHFHGGDFGGDRRRDTGGDHQADQYGAKFAHHADGDDLGNHGLGVEARTAGVDLQGQRAAGEDRRQAHHGQRQPTYLHQRVEQLARIEGRAQDVAEGREGEERDPSQHRQRGQRVAPERGEGRQDQGHPPV